LTKIYLIRHAEAEGNIYRRAHGHYNGLVSDRGFTQMEHLRKRFEGELINAIYSSDLLRASTTATALSLPRGLPVSETEMLREVGMGVWEDTAWGDIAYLYSDMSDKFSNDPARWSVSGSETYDNVKKRMYCFITETAKKHDSATIVFFSHGFAIRAFMCFLEGIASYETYKMPYCDNTAVALINYDKGAFKVEYHSDNSHLSDENSTLAHQMWWRKDMKEVNENLRFMPLNEVCSDDLLRIFRAKAGERACVDKQYAAFLMDEPVGIVGIDEKKEYMRNIGWMSYIHIVPANRNKGYGTQLLGLAISIFRKQKREKLRIELPSGSPGIIFMNKRGFRAIDVTDTICLMEKDIKNW